MRRYSFTPRSLDSPHGRITMRPYGSEFFDLGKRGQPAGFPSFEQEADDAGKGGSIQVSKSISTNIDPCKFITQDSRGTRPYGKRRHGLAEIVRAFKSFSSRRINQMRDTHGIAVWQRNYYEHIVRNQAELEHIGEYIAGNPQQWATDEENPEMTG